MKRSLIFSSLFLFLFLQNFTLACGDKFLVLGRGLRYERAHPAVHPTSILIYSTNANATKDLSKMLEKAGHKIKNVPTEELLYSSLNNAKYDVVLLNIADAPNMERKIMDTPSAPAVLPVINKDQGSEFDTKANQYPCILKYKDKNRNPITVIDQVMEDRLKGKPMQCKWSK
jgi:hypothetical protein